MCPAELRFGTVQAFEKGKAKVLFQDGEQIVSPWLQVGYARTKDDQEYEPLAEGEPVACLMNDNNESGLVVACVYSEAVAPPADAEQLWTRRFKDGTKLTYDREEKKLTVECEGDVEVKTKADATVEATGKVAVKGATVELN